jgi:hypothetical protein
MPAHAQTDHRRELDREARHADQLRGESGQADPGAEAEQRGCDRQAHRDDRAERDQQDDHGGQQSDPRGSAQ